MRLVFAYLTAMIIANLSAATFGPWVTPINSFLFIGFDLTVRDKLQEQLPHGAMFATILAAGGLTFFVSPGSADIVIASSVAFTLSALFDWFAFTRIRGSRLVKSNGSNVVGAAVDSLVFPTIAFGGFMLPVVAAQFATKVAGGAIWSFLLFRNKDK